MRYFVCSAAAMLTIDLGVSAATHIRVVPAIRQPVPHCGNWGWTTLKGDAPNWCGSTSIKAPMNAHRPPITQREERPEAAALDRSADSLGNSLSWLSGLAGADVGGSDAVTQACRLTYCPRLRVYHPYRRVPTKARSGRQTTSRYARPAPDICPRVGRGHECCAGGADRQSVTARRRTGRTARPPCPRSVYGQARAMYA
jgi:hypothetical protein